MTNLKHKKIILNFSSNDNGGAGGAAYLLHSNLNKANYNSFLFVARKTKNDKKVFQLRDNLTYKFQSKIVQLKNYLKLTNKNFFFLDSEINFNIDPESIYKIIKTRKISCIIIHSVPNFLDMKNILYLKKWFNCKVYIRLNDMQNFTGGCSFSLGCQKYKKNCHDCPGVKSAMQKNKIYQNFLKKKRILKLINPEVLSNSHHTMYRSEKSTLFKNFVHHYLPTGIESKLFYPKKILKKKGKKIILLFPSSEFDNYRKGFNYFVEALKKIKFKKRLKIILIGAKKEYFKHLNLETKNVKYIKQQRFLNKIFNQAHFSVIPSVDETGPTMLNMSMMASTPCIAFNIGDSYKYIVNNVSGFKCQNKDIKNLAKNIDSAIGMSDEKFRIMKKKCRKIALKSFTSKAQISIIKKII